MTNLKTVKAKIIAEICDISLARVGQLSKEGVIQKQPNGEYLPNAVTHYIKFIRESKPKTDYQELLDQEKYREKKRQNDIEEKLVAPVEKLNEALEKIAAAMVPILENFPMMLKRNWPEVTGDQTLLAKKTVAECLNAIDDIKVKVE